MENINKYIEKTTKEFKNISNNKNWLSGLFKEAKTIARGGLKKSTNEENTFEYTLKEIIIKTIEKSDLERKKEGKTPRNFKRKNLNWEDLSSNMEWEINLKKAEIKKQIIEDIKNGNESLEKFNKYKDTLKNLSLASKTNFSINNFVGNKTRLDITSKNLVPHVSNEVYNLSNVSNISKEIEVFTNSMIEKEINKIEIIKGEKLISDKLNKKSLDEEKANELLNKIKAKKINETRKDKLEQKEIDKAASRDKEDQLERKSVEKANKFREEKLEQDKLKEQNKEKVQDEEYEKMKKSVEKINEIKKEKLEQEKLKEQNKEKVQDKEYEKMKKSVEKINEIKKEKLEQEKLKEQNKEKVQDEEYEKMKKSVEKINEIKNEKYNKLSKNISKKTEEKNKPAKSKLAK